MVLDSKITLLKHHFGIFQPADWQSVEPSWILAIDGVGPATLEHLRLYLSFRDLTLKGDRTAEYWRAHLSHVKIGQTLGDDEEGEDRGVLFPYTILIDSAEQSPYTFQNMREDSGKRRPIIVPTESVCLGRYPDSLGDYSIDAARGRCHIERKSMADAHGTFLGWQKKGEDVGRRERFEKELANLSEIQAGLVVVECTFTDLIKFAPETKNTAQRNAKTLMRSILAWQQDYAVQWSFCDGRRLAEVVTFRWLERFVRKQAEAVKAENRKVVVSPVPPVVASNAAMPTQLSLLDSI